jgi:hypothetical protein
MKQGFLRAASILICAGTFAFLSCEKHHVGELPEVQRDKLNDVKSGRPQMSEHGAPNESAAPNGSASPAATPVDFFPSPTASPL